MAALVRRITRKLYAEHESKCDLSEAIIICLVKVVFLLVLVAVWPTLIVGFCQEYNDVTFSIYIITMHHRSCKHVLLRLSVILVSLYLHKKLGVHAGCMYVIYIKHMTFAHLTLVH